MFFVTLSNLIQLKEKNGEIKRIQQASDEVTRHNEAMSEEISHLSNKLEMYPKTIQDLKAEIEKLSTKVLSVNLHFDEPYFSLPTTYTTAEYKFLLHRLSCMSMRACR